MTFSVQREVGSVSHLSEVFGGWGNEAQEALSRVAKKLASKQVVSGLRC